MNLQKIVFILVCFTVMIGLSNADCCGTMFSCDGKGECNIFCCNCDDGCKQNYMLSAQLPSKTTNPIPDAKDIFKAVDKDNNGSITYEEAVEYIVKNGGGKKDKFEKDHSWFTKMDKNNDGIIVPNEFDSSFIKH